MSFSTDPAPLSSREQIPPTIFSTRTGGWIRGFSVLGLILAASLFAISLLAWLPAPTTFFWLLAIGATEFGHWFGAGSLALGGVVLFSLGRREHSQRLIRATLVLSALASVLFFSPFARAWLSLPQFQAQLARAFPLPASSPAPPITLSFLKLWSGTGPQTAPIENIEFDQSQHLFLRFFRSQKPGPAPCIIVVHTGGWNNGSPDEFAGFNQHLAQRGYAVAAIEYRLAPRWTWPAQHQDVIEAMKFLRQQAPRLGLDPQRFVLLGRSAGGQIAEAVAYSLHDPTVRGVIAFYSPADMHFAYRYARSDDILDSLKLLTDYLGGSPSEEGTHYDSASGFGLVHQDCPPTLLLHGNRDELVWVLQSQRLAAQLQKTGVAHCFLQLNWATHAFDYQLNSPGGQISTQAVDWFLDSILPPPPNR